MSNITTVSSPHRCTESELAKLYDELEEISTLADRDRFDRFDRFDQSDQSDFAHDDFHQLADHWMEADEKLTADEMIEHINEGKEIVKEWKEWVRAVRC